MRTSWIAERERIGSVMLALAGLLSACVPASRPATAEGHPPGRVVLATFRGDVDPVAGTMTVRSEGTPEASALGVLPRIIPEPSGVSVANDGAMWRGVAGHCTDPLALSSGRPVKLTLGTDHPVGSNTFLTGVYAEITELSATDSSGCNSVTSVPAGLSNAKGLWSYGGLGTLFPRSGTTDWAFSWNGGAPFTFRGQVVAVVGLAVNADYFCTYTMDPLAPCYSAMAPNGTNVVFPLGFDLGFLAPDGTVTTVSSLMPGFIFGLATDVPKNRIWVTSSLFGGLGTVGLTDGSGALIATADLADVAGVIVADPAATPTRAWFAAFGNGYVNSVTASGASLTLGTPVALPGGNNPSFLAFGADGRLYVTSNAASRIYSFTTDGTLQETFDVSGDCAGPAEITAGPGGKLWFSARTSRNVCTVTPGTAGAAKVATMPSYAPNALEQGPDGNVWVAVWGAEPGGPGGYVARVTPAGNVTAYPVAPGNAIDVTGITTLGSDVWVDTNNGPSNLATLQRLSP